MKLGIGLEDFRITNSEIYQARGWSRILTTKVMHLNKKSDIRQGI